ncbi:MAG: hypothetical protein COT16_03255 [Elusimicrobia bacterium CG08_land_8_20_14_0_20_44_26]|nr:MAG: hypothetical protein COT16_03255 [Elusimicrobia bacterium CG08_land_8_20_14_0_20_44_26]
MQLGRNFTNMLETTYLSDEEKQNLKNGKLTVPDMDATVQVKSKRDITNQIDVIRELGLNHLELDGGVPNPFLEMSDGEIEKIKKYAAEKNVTISVHLPYTFVAASIATFQEEDREVACTLMKRYIDFAAKIDAKIINMHPGSVPFYQAVGKYLEMVNGNLVKSINELCEYCDRYGIVTHVENNTAFDIIGVENDEMLEIIDRVRRNGFDLKYCFDIGHWFTRALPQFGKKPLREPPEKILEEIPTELLCEVHLNDFIINGTEFQFHPPLHRELGFLKKRNLKNLARIFREKGVKVIVVETAVRELKDLLKSMEILKEESEYLGEIFL